MPGVSKSLIQRIKVNQASQADNAQNAVNARNAQTAVSASYALTASYTNFVLSASYASSSTSASYALTASYANFVLSASYASSSTSASYAAATTTAISSSYPIAVTGTTIYSTGPLSIASPSNTNNIFLGQEAGAIKINESIFLGKQTGKNAEDAAYSILLGSYVGSTSVTANSIGNNNIIIGNSITLPIGKANAINIGGILFGSGSYWANTGIASSSPAGGNIGINIVDPQFNLHVSGTVGFSNLNTSNTAPNVVLADSNGQLFITASSALSPATSLTASFVTASNVWGPYGSSSIASASYASGSTSASYAAFAFSSSYASSSTSASFATTASYTNFALSSSYASSSTSASYADFAFSASYASSSTSASYTNFALSSSYASSSTSASYALTASYVATVSSIKAGSASIASFNGNPSSSIITFGTPFPNNLYAITVTGEDARSWTIQSKVSGSFIVNSNSIVALQGPLYWIAVPYNS